VDLFDYYTPDLFREKSEQRRTGGRQKPRTMTEFDRDIVKLVRQTLHLGNSDLLHPTHMYRLFQGFWQSKAPLDAIDRFAPLRPLPAIDTSDVAGSLPNEFVAARFYFNDAFPDTEENRRFAGNLLASLAESTDVVLMNPATRLDDLQDVPVTQRRRIHSIADLLSSRTSLEVQSKVIARSRAFVGTHGGLSYLGPLYGVRSLSFYSTTRPDIVRHLELAAPRLQHHERPARISRSTSTTSARSRRRWARTTKRSPAWPNAACSDRAVVAHSRTI
jgi:hypothetical protein